MLGWQRWAGYDGYYTNGSLALLATRRPVDCCAQPPKPVTLAPTKWPLVTAGIATLKWTPDAPLQNSLKYLIPKRRIWQVSWRTGARCWCEGCDPL